MTYDSWKAREPDYDDEPPVEDDGRDAFIAALRDKIKTWQFPDAPRPFLWCACVGDYDLDATTGHGVTEGEAIADLFEQLVKGDPQ